MGELKDKVTSHYLWELGGLFHEKQQSAEYKQLRWMSLAVSKRRRSSEAVLLDS